MVLVCVLVLAVSFYGCKEEEPKPDYLYWQFGEYQLASFNIVKSGYNPDIEEDIPYTGIENVITDEIEISNYVREYIQSLGETVSLSAESLNIKTHLYSFKYSYQGDVTEWYLRDSDVRYISVDKQCADYLIISRSMAIYRNFPNPVNTFVDYYYLTIRTIPLHVQINNQETDIDICFKYKKQINSTMIN